MYEYRLSKSENRFFTNQTRKRIIKTNSEEGTSGPSNLSGRLYLLLGQRNLRGSRISETPKNSRGSWEWEPNSVPKKDWLPFFRCFGLFSMLPFSISSMLKWYLSFTQPICFFNRIPPFLSLKIHETFPIMFFYKTI